MTNIQVLINEINRHQQIKINIREKASKELVSYLPSHPTRRNVKTKAFVSSFEVCKTKRNEKN